MPYSQIATNKDIVLDSSDNLNLLQYETHISLMYRYAIATLMLMLIVCLLTGCDGGGNSSIQIQRNLQGYAKKGLQGFCMTKNFNLIVNKILTICISCIEIAAMW